MSEAQEQRTPDQIEADIEQTREDAPNHDRIRVQRPGQYVRCDGTVVLGHVQEHVEHA